MRNPLQATVTGTGLGLPYARRLAADPRAATITLASEPGQGSTFTVRLPVGGPPDTGGGERTDRALSVLVAEDDEAFRTAAAAVLRVLRPHRRRGGRRAHRAGRRSRSARPIVILLDLRMAHVDGSPCSTRSAPTTRCAHIPVVVLTAYPPDAHQPPGAAPGGGRARQGQDDARRAAAVGHRRAAAHVHRGRPVRPGDRARRDAGMPDPGRHRARRQRAGRRRHTVQAVRPGSWLRRRRLPVIEASTGAEALRPVPAGRHRARRARRAPAGHQRLRGVRADQGRPGARHDTGDPCLGGGDPRRSTAPRGWSAAPTRTWSSRSTPTRLLATIAVGTALLPGPAARRAAGRRLAGSGPVERRDERDDKPAGACCTRPRRALRDIFGSPVGIVATAPDGVRVAAVSDRAGRAVSSCARP